MSFAWNYLVNLVAIMGGRHPERPLLFSYYITHRCDLDCGYCSDGEGRRFRDTRVPELSTSQAKELISILSRSADTLDITGGEPMVRDDLEQILQHARNVGMRTVLNTKAVGLKDRPDLARLADVLVISVDALDVTRLAELIGRPASVASRILEAVEFVLAQRPATCARVVLSAVATVGNLEDAAEVLRFALERGLGFHLSPQIVGRQVHSGLRGNRAYVELVDRVRSAKRERRGVLGVPEYLGVIRDFHPYRCHPLLMPVIRPDGHLYFPCLEFGRAEVGILEAGGYERALRRARAEHGEVRECRESCGIFCHAGLSLFQRHPWSAIREGRHWRRILKGETP